MKWSRTTGFLPAPRPQRDARRAADNRAAIIGEHVQTLSLTFFMTELGSLHGSRTEPLVSRCNEAAALSLQGLRQGSEGSAAAGCSEHEFGGITDQAGLR